jgi:Lon-like ATP-dependent protease
MVGATTRTADEIPPAIRSRCLEIFFRALLPNEIALIAKNAVDKIEFQIDERGIDVVSQYATNGREAVNIIQISAGIAIGEGRQHIKASDIEWVVHNSQISPRQEKKIHKHPQVGFINGLAVYGPNMGTILEVEVSAIPTQGRKGEVTITGLIEEETIGGGRRTVKRKSMAKGSVENVLTVLRKYMQVDTNQHDIHINFPGGIPIDGPSAGITIATGVYSAIKGFPISNTIAMTGEISIHGYVKPVGGVISKVEAAKQAGVKKVFIPRENWQEIFSEMIGIEVIAVERLEEVLKYVFDEQVERSILVPTGEILSASTI